VLVTFDFDDTLVFVGERPNEPVLAELRRVLDQGHDAAVVTARTRARDLQGDHGVPIPAWLRAWGLQVPVYYTDEGLKGRLLAELGSSLHYDDHPAQLASAHRHGVRTYAVTTYH
jgi:FMN phosphatase YigB (HAD superfamily)